MKAGNALPIACALSGPDQVARRKELTDGLFTRIARTVELEDGVALHFHASSDAFVQIAAFIDFESVCCRFLSFETLVSPDAEEIVLRIRGPEGTKAFLSDWLGSPI